MKTVWPLVALLWVWGLGAQAQGAALPEYPGARHTRIGNDLVIAGEYFRIAYFLTDDAIPQVARHFQKVWREQGYPVTVDGKAPDEVVVSAFHTREGLQQSVVLRTHGKRTLGFTVVRDLWATPPDREPEGLLPKETALFAQDLAARGTDNGAHHRSSLLPFGLDKATSRVRERLESKGYTLGKDSGGRTSDGKRLRVLEHRKGHEQVLSSLIEIDGETSALAQSWLRDEAAR